jgi:anti-sigma B factor antagonist
MDARSLRVEQDQDEVVLFAAGELDLDSACDIVRAGRAALQDGVRLLRVDLAGVTFMDSVALSLLIDLHRNAVRRRARMWVSCPSGPVRALFAATRTEKLLDVRAAQPAS